MPRPHKMAGHRPPIRMCLPLALKRHVTRDRIRPDGAGPVCLRPMSPLQRLLRFVLWSPVLWLLWPFSPDGYGRAMFPRQNALKSIDASLFGVSSTKDPMPHGSGAAMFPPTLSPFLQPVSPHTTYKAPNTPFGGPPAVALSMRESLLSLPRYRFDQSLRSSSHGRPFIETAIGCIPAISPRLSDPNSIYASFSGANSMNGPIPHGFGAGTSHSRNSPSSIANWSSGISFNIERLSGSHGCTLALRLESAFPRTSSEPNSARVPRPPSTLSFVAALSRLDLHPPLLSLPQLSQVSLSVNRSNIETTVFSMRAMFRIQNNRSFTAPSLYRRRDHALFSRLSGAAMFPQMFSVLYRNMIASSFLSRLQNVEMSDGFGQEISPLPSNPNCTGFCCSPININIETDINRHFSLREISPRPNSPSSTVLPSSLTISNTAEAINPAFAGPVMYRLQNSWSFIGPSLFHISFNTGIMSSPRCCVPGISRYQNSPNFITNWSSASDGLTISSPLGFNGVFQASSFLRHRSTMKSSSARRLAFDLMNHGCGVVMSPPTLSASLQTCLVRNSVKAPKHPFVCRPAVALSMQESPLLPPRYRFRLSILSSFHGRPFTETGIGYIPGISPQRRDRNSINGLFLVANSMSGQIPPGSGAGMSRSTLSVSPRMSSVPNSAVAFNPVFTPSPDAVFSTPAFRPYRFLRAVSLLEEESNPVSGRSADITASSGPAISRQSSNRNSIAASLSSSEFPSGRIQADCGRAILRSRNRPNFIVQPLSGRPLFRISIAVGCGTLSLPMSGFNPNLMPPSRATAETRARTFHGCCPAINPFQQRPNSTSLQSAV